MNYRIEQLRFLLREDPSSRVFYQLAELLRKEGQPTEAVEILTRGLERHPRYVAAWVSLGRAQLQLDAVLEAERAFQRALELDPQNAVAARLIGETAILLEDWPRAAKVLRLARELAPSDLTLDDKIATVEGHLGGSPAIIAEAVGTPRDRSRDTAKIRVAEVIRLSPEDPFAVTSGGDTGVWRLTHEVFAEGEAMAADEMADEAAEERADEVPADEAIAEVMAEVVSEITAGPAELDDELADGLAVAEEPLVEVRVEVEEIALEDEGAEEEMAPTSEALPLPTMTLARLAIQQGDIDLAEATLVSLLERDPDHPEAGELLAEVRRSLGGGPDPTVAAVKVAALEGWLATVRRAAERQAR
jgi:predicted Zn-dependent protease